MFSDKAVLKGTKTKTPFIKVSSSILSYIVAKARKIAL